MCRRRLNRHCYIIFSSISSNSNHISELLILESALDQGEHVQHRIRNPQDHAHSSCTLCEHLEPTGPLSTSVGVRGAAGILLTSRSDLGTTGRSSCWREMEIWRAIETSAAALSTSSDDDGGVLAFATSVMRGD